MTTLKHSDVLAATCLTNEETQRLWSFDDFRSGEARPPIHGRAEVLRQKTELGSGAKCGACCQALLCTCVYGLCASTLMCACAGARDRIGPRASPSEHRALTMDTRNAARHQSAPSRGGIRFHWCFHTAFSPGRGPSIGRMMMKVGAHDGACGNPLLFPKDAGAHKIFTFKINRTRR